MVKLSGYGKILGKGRCLVVKDVGLGSWLAYGGWQVRGDIRSQEASVSILM